ncbi:hypothetical protein LTS17_012065 [Exophiala oligosperma]
MPSFLNWYRAAMGANISKSDEDAIIVNNDVEVVSSSSSSSQTDLTSVQELQASTSSVPPTPSIESAHPCHRLPPVESREAVRNQASYIRYWQAVDGEGDLYESGPVDQWCATQSVDQDDSNEDLSPNRLSTSTQALQNNPSENTTVKQSTSPPNSRGLSPWIGQSQRTSRLIVTEKAIEIALYRSNSSGDHFRPAGYQTSSAYEQDDTFKEVAGWSFRILEETKNIHRLTQHQSHGLSVKCASTGSVIEAASGTTCVEDGFPPNDLCQENFSLYQDEDFDNNEQLNENDIDQTLPGKSSELEEDEKLIRNLTLVQPENIVLFEAIRAFDQIPSRLDDELEDENLKAARQWMLRDQAEGAQRSRVLREKALRRRNLCESTPSPPFLEVESHSPSHESVSKKEVEVDDIADIRLLPTSDMQVLCEENSSRDLNKIYSSRPMSGLDLLAIKRGTELNIQTPSRIDRGESEPKVSISVKKGPDITLPANFDAYGEEEQNIVVNHETAKERKRDLDAIERAIYWMGYLRCCGPFNEKDRNDINQLRKFISLVVDNCEGNRFTRRRVQDIRDKMKRRAGKFKAPAPGEITGWQARLFPGRLDRLKEEMGKADEQVQQFGALRLNKTVKRKHGDRKHRKNKVHFIDSAATQQTKLPKADQLRERLKEQLKLFEDTEVPEITDLPEQTEFVDYHQSDSDESEEDEGAQFVYGAGRDTASSSFNTTAGLPCTRQSQEYSQDILEISRLENARQANSRQQGTQPMATAVAAAGVKGQAFDGELLKRMQAKRALQDLGIDLTVIKATTEVQEAIDFVSETSDSSDDDDIEEDQWVFQYTVLGSFAGIPSFRDGDDYVFKKTFDPLSAEIRLKQVIQDVSTQYVPQGGYEGGNWSLNTSYRHGLIEQHFTIGEDADVEARLWIEKEQVEVDKKLFRRAKARRFGSQNIHYTVEWEKIVSPVVDETDGDTVDTGATTSAGNESVVAKKDEDDLDSLFGDNSTTTPPQQQGDGVSTSAPSRRFDVVTTAMPREDLRTYTTPVLANRHAKDYYMAWYATFFPGVANEGYRRMEDEAVEDELESMGAWGLWSREESFTRRARRDEDEDEDDEDEMGDQKVQEKFKVWVRKVEVLGPRN